MISQLLFACPEDFFDCFLTGNFFPFLYIDCNFRISFKNVSTWANIFRPFGRSFLTGTSERYFMRPFRHLEIFWVTFRKIQHQIDKNSKTSIILVTWEKHLGSSVFQQGCWICNQCVHLNNLKPSNFQTIAKVFVTMSKKMFGLRKTIFGSDFKTALFSAGECFEKKL